MADFSFPSFNRRYVLFPMLAALALVAASYLVTEERRTYVMGLSLTIRDRQDRMRALADLIYAASDAESAQRGFLLTSDPAYLDPFTKAKGRASLALDELMDRYQMRDPDEVSHLLAAQQLIDSKFKEMQLTIDMARSLEGLDKALQVVRTDMGMHWMEELRGQLEGILVRERTRVYVDIDFWEDQVSINRYISGATSLLNVLLLLMTGVLVTREIERRNHAAAKLDALVVERTAELSELSEHTMRVSEHEKSQLARELHDELGGLLVAMKMDLAQLAKKFDFTQPDVVARWQRIQSALTSGVALKRRVIEELRPTLLDNMGLVAALRWQSEETCSQANIVLTAQFPAEELRLDANVAIAIFRVVQEALTNVAKHSRATAVDILLQVSNDELYLVIEDNGVGLPVVASGISGSHGLLSMKYRMQAIGGSFHMVPAAPSGTRVIVRLPLEIANAMAMLV